LSLGFSSSDGDIFLEDKELEGGGLCTEFLEDDSAVDTFVRVETDFVLVVGAFVLAFAVVESGLEVEGDGVSSLGGNGGSSSPDDDIV